MIRPSVRGRGRRSERDRGAAAVEFALIMIPLLLIVFGIISYGFLLSFRQSVSQAAAEGARAAAVAAPTADRQAIASRAVKNVLGAACGSTYVTCSFVPVVDSDPAAGPPCPVTECITVTVTYLYKADPSKPIFPGSGVAIPEKLVYTAVSRISS